MKRSLLAACVVALLVPLVSGQGCVTAPSDRLSHGVGVGVSTGAGAGGGGGPDSGTMPPPATDKGIPCEVSLLLVKYCRACHSTPPIAGTSTSLMTYEDLLAPMPGDPSTTIAAASLARMKDTAAPMPPGFLLPAAELAPFEAWVSAGMPAEECATDGTVPDGGAPVNPYDTPPVCTSDSYWTQGDESSPDMLPGRACIACHSAPGGDEGPRFRFSGTVYPTAHEPDDCNGVGGAQIEVTDANGAVFTVTAGPSGNFFQGGDPADLAMPIKARVIHDGKILPMVTAVDTGDCNACHTQNGKEGAPGRIILPP